MTIYVECQLRPIFMLCPEDKIFFPQHIEDAQSAYNCYNIKFKVYNLPIIVILHLNTDQRKFSEDEKVQLEWSIR